MAAKGKQKRYQLTYFVVKTDFFPHTCDFILSEISGRVVSSKLFIEIGESSYVQTLKNFLDSEVNMKFL